MKVLKFGGTSVGSASLMKNVASLICDGEQKFVVLSAMAGTTNTLVEINNYYSSGNCEGAQDIIKSLQQEYSKHISELYSTEKYRRITEDFIDGVFAFLNSFSGHPFGRVEERIILAQGEIMSTNMFVNYLMEQGQDVRLLPALDFMKVDENAEPDLVYITDKLGALINKKEASIYVTQGYICRNSRGEIDNLRRGGSDYTASLVGAAIAAEEIQIWTDIDGMHDSDPRIVDGTKAVRRIHFDEASELAYFGARVLHPTCILPARMANIPVRILNTLEPDAEGTLINNDLEHGTIKSVAAKEDIVAIRIKSSRMLLAYGFMRKVFEIFENYKTSVDMICTSEVGVTLTIDDTTHLNHIIHELKRYGTVTVDMDMCIICVVGDMDWENVGFEARALDAMKDIPVRMISYGGSNYNISFLVRREDKERSLKALGEKLIN